MHVGIELHALRKELKELRETVSCGRGRGGHGRHFRGGGGWESRSGMFHKLKKTFWMQI